MAESIVVKSPKTGREFSFSYYKGDTIAEAIELFGEEIVKNKFDSQVDTDLGNAIRRLLNENKSEEDINKFIDGWKPGLKRVGSGGGKKKAGPKEWAVEYKAADTTPERKAELKRLIQNYIAEMQAAAAAIAED